MKFEMSLMTRASLCAAMCLASSCAMPPREAWGYVQTHGLIPYMMGGYDGTGGTRAEPNRYLATSSPLQRRQDVHVPYRPEPEVKRDVPPYRPRTERIVADSTPSSPVPERKPTHSHSDSTPTKESSSSVSTPKVSMESLPYGTPVAGRPGMVMSPFASKEQLVDVTGMAAGDPVKCPYSGKLFRVPPTQQAAASKTIDSAITSPAPASEPTPSAEADKPKP